MAKWMKWLAGVVLCFTLVVGMIPKHVWAQETTGESSEIATVTRTVSFRSGPSTSDERYRYLQKGEDCVSSGTYERLLVENPGQ